MRADVAHLAYSVPAKLVLHTERPLLGVGRTEVWGNYGLRQEERVKLAERQNPRRDRATSDRFSRQRSVGNRDGRVGGR